MRVAQIVESLAIGGLERMAVDLAIALKKRGLQSLLYCVCTDGPLRQVAERAGIAVYLFNKAPGFSPNAMVQIARQAARDRLDIVNTHNSVIHHYGAPLRLNGIPVVNTAHGMGAASLPPRQMRLFRLSMPLTAAVVFVSEDSRRLLWDAGNFPPEKAYVIRNGIPVQSFFASSAQPGNHRPRIRFGSVARLVPVKDHSLMLRAFADVRKDVPTAELHIVGAGPLEQDIRREAIALGLGDSFQLLPGDSDVPSFLGGLDIFLLSSKTEGLPIAVLEAMAAGLPIVSTRVGGIPEAAPEGRVGWYASAGDCAALVDAMRRAIASPELPRMGKEAAVIVGERFSVEKMAAEYEELYLRILDGSPSTSAA